MFFYLRRPLASVASTETSFSSDNSFVPNVNTAPSTVFRQLRVDELDEVSSMGFNQQYAGQRQSFDIPRPLFTIPRPTMYLPTNDSLRTEQFSPIPTPSLISQSSGRALYQNLPPLPNFPLPPPLPSFPTQYSIEPSPMQRYTPLPVARPFKRKKSTREKPPGLLTTLSAGGFSTLAALIYLLFLLALPIAKLVIGILYVKECPVNRNIPLYMVTAGACGLANAILILLSSACRLCRSLSDAKKRTHGLMICTIGLARGMQGALALFLFIWFFFGNVWVFNVRYRLRTDKPDDVNNYCHPTLYWFAFYVLVFTYVYAIFTCCAKFCVNFVCCGAFDAWHKAFS